MLKRFAFLFLLSAAALSAQGYRFDSQVSQELLTTQIANTTNVIVIPAAPQIAFCAFPANAVPCTNKATTFTSVTLGTPCSASTQIVLTGTSSCVASPDAQANWGVWVPSGQYSYTITLPGGVNLGPYVVNFGVPNGTALTLGALTTNGPNTLNGGGTTAGAWTHASLHTFSAGLTSTAGPNSFGGVTTFLNTPTPASAAGANLGSQTLPWNGLVIGGAGNQASTLLSMATANRNDSIPDAAGTFSLAAIEYCGATTGATQACAKTIQALPIIVWGDVLLNTATSQSITTLPFTDALYSCTGSDLTTAAGIVSFNTYAAASVTIQESGGTNADHLRYVCVGH